MKDAGWQRSSDGRSLRPQCDARFGEGRISRLCLRAACAALVALGLLSSNASAACPNEAVRVQQGVTTLPECRAYELVSPGDSGGVPFTNPVRFPPETGVLRSPMNPVASSGEAVAIGAAGQVPGYDTMGVPGDLFVSRRGPAGWIASYEGIPSVKGPFPNASAIALSADLENQLYFVQGPAVDPLVPHTQGPDGEQPFDLYLKDDSGDFRSLLRGAADPLLPEGSLPYGIDLSADGSVALLTSEAELSPGAPKSALYRNDNGVNELISRDELGNPVPFVPGGAAVLSDDGDVAAFGDGGYTSNDHVWVFRAGDANVDASASRRTPPDAAAPKRLLALTPDGSTVLFSTAEELTNEDTDTSVDLYAYQVEAETLELVSIGLGGGGNSDACAAPNPVSGSRCDVRLVSVSDDGRYVYFASPEMLASGAAENAANLFVRDRQSGTVIFVAQLAESDVSLAPWLNGGSGITVTAMIAGDSLGFLTSQSQDGYDNGGYDELYLYDPSVGELDCVSCRPDGSTAEGNAQLVGEPGGPWGRPLYGTADGGVIFFTTSDPLVLQDTNGVADVYAWHRSSGKADLLSPGYSASPSRYIGNGSNGRDVFFSTRETLEPGDRNGWTEKVYDARAEGGAFVPSSVECVDSCRPGATPPSPPPVGTEAPAADRGSLTSRQRLKKALRACRKLPARKRRHCERKAKHKYRNSNRRGVAK